MQEEGGFGVTVRVELPEAVGRAACRVAFRERAAELWAVGERAAYRLWLPRLYKPVQPHKCRVRVSPRTRAVTLVLQGLDDQPWPHLKGA